MKVKELIDQLSTMPDDYDVLTKKTELLGNVGEVVCVRIDEYASFGASVPCVLITDEWKYLEEEEKEIGIGDEVECDGMRGVLVREPYKIGGDKKTTMCLIWYGTHMSSTDIHKVKPTGRHFNEIDKLFQALREGEAE